VLNPTYRQEEELMSSSARQGQETEERVVAVDPDEVSREEIRAELLARELKSRASADAVGDRKKSKGKSALNPAEEAALGSALLYNPAVGG
jgi:hypothetical protein